MVRANPVTKPSLPVNPPTMVPLIPLLTPPMVADEPLTLPVKDVDQFSLPTEALKEPLLILPEFRLTSKPIDKAVRLPAVPEPLN